MEEKRWARFTAWVVVCCGGRQGGAVDMARGCWWSLLGDALCDTAAADAQVGGDFVHGALDRDDDAVREAFEGTDLIGVQVLVDKEQRSAHHHKEQELEQQGQEASSNRCCVWGDREARPGQRLRIQVVFGVDIGLHAGLIQPVLTWF